MSWFMEPSNPFFYLFSFVKLKKSAIKGSLRLSPSMFVAQEKKIMHLGHLSCSLIFVVILTQQAKLDWLAQTITFIRHSVLLKLCHTISSLHSNAMFFISSIDAECCLLSAQWSHPSILYYLCAWTSAHKLDQLLVDDFSYVSSVGFFFKINFWEF